MMGHRQVDQAALFYEFSLETHVPADHLLRSIDRFVELGELRRELAGFYSAIGRPSVDPELMIRMLIVGYCLGIRSERRLCEEVHLNLAYRWFCRLGLDGGVPDHSTFSKNRHGRFRQSDLLRRLFETVLRRCISEGLVGGEGFAVDASLIKADANRQKGIEGEKGLPAEAAGRAAKEYLAVLDDAAFGAASEVTPKFISPADPAARWTAAHGGQAFFAYSTNYLIDVENAIIVDVEATTAIRQAEVIAAKRMIERSMERFDLYPARLMGDSAYGSADMLGWLVHEHGIEPHVTVFDKSARKDGTFSRDDFTYDHERDIYFCPGGKTLTTTGTLVNDDATMLFSLGDGRNGPSELPLQAGGNPNNRCARPALRGGVDTPRRGSGIVAIGGDRASAGAEIVVGIGPVEGRCHVGVPGQIVGILVLPVQISKADQNAIISPPRWYKKSVRPIAWVSFDCLSLRTRKSLGNNRPLLTRQSNSQVPCQA
jgi:transposase